MSKKKYTKCECCPYYAKDKKDNKWKCARIHIWKSVNDECIFRYNDMEEERVSVLNRWIDANKG